MHARVAAHLWKTLSGWEAPLAYLKDMVARGETGLESGTGYYDWSDRDPEAVRAEKDDQLLRRTRHVMVDWETEQRKLLD